MDRRFDCFFARDIFLIKYSFIIVIVYRLSTHIYILIYYVKL